MIEKMKKANSLLVLLFSLVMMASCSKDGVDIDVIDPQHVEFINIVIDQDLIDAFGEEYLHFGHTPPNLEGISFKVRGMDYDTCIRYIFNAQDPDAPPIQSHTDPPTYDGSTNYHHFFDHAENISHHKLKTIDPYNDTYIRENDTVYVVGVDDSQYFTAYYEEIIKEEGSGHPTNGIIISGKLEYDDQGVFIGISNYRIGKKILSYREHPTKPSYAQGTIEIKTHSGLAPAEDWD